MFSRIKVHGVNLYAPSQEDLKSRGMQNVNLRFTFCYRMGIGPKADGLCSQSKAKLLIVPKAPFIQDLFLEEVTE